MPEYDQEETLPELMTRAKCSAIETMGRQATGDIHAEGVVGRLEVTGVESPRMWLTNCPSRQAVSDSAATSDPQQQQNLMDVLPATIIATPDTCSHPVILEQNELLHLHIPDS